MEVFIARQPIYDTERRLYAYELLYRGGKMARSFENEVDADAATRTVLSNAITSFGLKTLTGGDIAFVNFTRSLLLSNMAELLNPGDFIIEILEDTVVDQMLLDRLGAWRQLGYSFAMDDYTGDAKQSALLPYVNIVKVDFRLTDKKQRGQIAKQLLPLKKLLLAEKVESEEEFSEALNSGYSLFQGFYFEQPVTLSTMTPEAHSSTCVQILRELAKPETSFSALASIIRIDVNMSYRLLSHVSTLQYYRGHPVSSVHTALTRMGALEIKRWITLIFMHDFTREKSDQNMKTALARGLFAERTAAELGNCNCDEAFMTGTFSMLNVIVDGEMPAILNEICISESIKDALMGKSGRLNDILCFVKDYEAGRWDNVVAFVKANKLNSETVFQYYFGAVKSADEALA